MTFAEAVTEVRARADKDLPAGASGETDSPVKDSQIKGWIVRERHAVRLMLADAAPTLYQAQATPNVAAGASTWTKQAGFLKLVRVERKTADGSYYAIDPVDERDPENADTLGFLEAEDKIVFYPTRSAPGDYRITWNDEPTTSTDGEQLDVPTIAEDVVIERAAARVRRRLREDPRLHLDAAKAAWDEARAYLARRYGVHSEGLVRTR